jgi:hypothetical protein
VFALGVVLYELLTRRRLYREKSDLLVMQRITQEDVVAPSTINPAVDTELDSIASQSLSKIAEERFATAAEFSEALDVWLAMQGHADCRAQLQRWMDAHADGLGIAVDETEAAAGAPSWEQSGAADAAPSDADATRASELEDAGGTVSTPALHPAQDMSGKHPRLEEDNALGPTERLPAVRDQPSVVTAANPPQHTVPSDTQVIDVGSQPSEMVVSVQDNAPIHDTIPPPSAFQPPSNSLVDVERAAKPLPLAAFVGGLIAVGLAAGVGFFLLRESTPPDELPDPPADVVVKPGQPSGDPSPGDPAAQDGGGEAAPADPPPAPDTARLQIRSEPEGVVVLVDGKAAGNAPVSVEYELTESKTVRASAVFPDQAPVTQDVELSPGGEYVVELRALARLSVRTTPIGAAVVLDGNAMGPSPRDTMWVDPSKAHVVAVSLNGFKPWQKQIKPKPGDHLILEPELTKAPAPAVRPSGGRSTRSRSPPADAGYGMLIVNSGPWAVVYIDGKRRGPTPLRLEKVRAGKRRIKVVNKEVGFSKQVVVDVKKDEKNSVGFRFEKKGNSYVFARLVR